MSEEQTFNLDTPCTNVYANMILQDMKNYKYWASRRYDHGIWISHGVTALNTLHDDMTPKGKEFMAQSYPELKTFGAREIYFYLHKKSSDEDIQWEILDVIYNKALEWLYPNILELHINVGKPAYSAEGHLGNKPR